MHKYPFDCILYLITKEHFLNILYFYKLKYTKRYVLFHLYKNTQRRFNLLKKGGWRQGQAYFGKQRFLVNKKRKKNNYERFTNKN